MEPLIEKPVPTMPAFTPALFNCFKAVFGTGLLAMPFGFVHLGILRATIITGIMGAWAIYTMYLISECVQLANAAGHNVTTFGGLVTSALGVTAGAVLGSANLVLHQLFCCAAYLVFIGDVVAQVLDGTGAVSIIVAVTPPFALLCCLKDMRLLGPTSASGTAMLVVVLVAVLYEGYKQEHADPAQPAAGSTPILYRGSLGGSSRPPKAAPPPSLSAVAAFMGVALFTFNGHDTVVPIVVSMGSAAPRFREIACWLLGVGVPAICGFSAAAAAAFGPRTPNNVLLALHSEQASVLKLLTAAVVFFTLPVKMFPAVAQLEPLLLRPDAPAWRRGALCCACASSSLLLAATLPDFGFLVASRGQNSRLGRPTARHAGLWSCHQVGRMSPISLPSTARSPSSARYASG